MTLTESRITTDTMPSEEIGRRALGRTALTGVATLVAMSVEVGLGAHAAVVAGTGGIGMGIMSYIGVRTERRINQLAQQETIENSGTVYEPESID